MKTHCCVLCVLWKFIELELSLPGRRILRWEDSSFTVWKVLPNDTCICKNTLLQDGLDPWLSLHMKHAHTTLFSFLLLYHMRLEQCQHHWPGEPLLGSKTSSQQHAGQIIRLSLHFIWRRFPYQGWDPFLGPMVAAQKINFLLVFSPAQCTYSTLSNWIDLLLVWDCCTKNPIIHRSCYYWIQLHYKMYEGA